MHQYIILYDYEAYLSFSLLHQTLWTMEQLISCSESISMNKKKFVLNFISMEISVALIEKEKTIVIKNKCNVNARGWSLLSRVTTLS